MNSPSTLLLNNHIYSIKDKQLRENYDIQMKKLEGQVSDGREINNTVTDGKRVVAEAITTKNVITEPDATFETMANNVLAIQSQLGYTPPANSATGTKPYKNFICEYPYRSYLAPRDAGFFMSPIVMKVGYKIPEGVNLKLSIISRVLRINENWNGVPVIACGGEHAEDFVIQFVSNTQIAYHTNRSTDPPYYTSDTRLINIQDIGSWHELVLEFKYTRDVNNIISTSINIANVVDDKIGEFIQIQSDSNLQGFLWAFEYTGNSLLYLSSQYTEYGVEPSMVNCNDMAFVVNDKIHTGNTSLYEFPDDFVIA